MPEILFWPVTVIHENWGLVWFWYILVDIAGVLAAHIDNHFVILMAATITRFEGRGG